MKYLAKLSHSLRCLRAHKNVQYASSKNTGNLFMSFSASQKSINAQQTKTRKIMDVNQAAVNELMEKYPDADLIHGHTHRLNTHIEPRFTRHVLGDWSNTQGNAIEITDKLSRLEIS